MTSMAQSAVDTQPTTQHQLPAQKCNKQENHTQGHLSGLRVADNPQSNSLIPQNICPSYSLRWFLTTGQWRASLSWIPSYTTLLFGNPFENPKRPHGFCSTIKSDLLGIQFGTITSVQTPVTCIDLLPHLSDEVM